MSQKKEFNYRCIYIIYGLILLLFLILNILDCDAYAEYLVYDQDDQAYRDYGTKDNYIEYLKHSVALCNTNEDLCNQAMLTCQSMASNYKKAYQQEVENRPGILDRAKDFIIGAGAGAVIVALILLL